MVRHIVLFVVTLLLTTVGWAQIEDKSVNRGIIMNNTPIEQNWGYQAGNPPCTRFADGSELCHNVGLKDWNLAYGTLTCWTTKESSKWSCQDREGYEVVWPELGAQPDGGYRESCGAMMLGIILQPKFSEAGTQVALEESLAKASQKVADELPYDSVDCDNANGDPKKCTVEPDEPDGAIDVPAVQEEAEFLPNGEWPYTPKCPVGFHHGSYHSDTDWPSCERSTCADKSRVLLPPDGNGKRWCHKIQP